MNHQKQLLIVDVALGCDSQINILHKFKTKTHNMCDCKDSTKTPTKSIRVVSKTGRVYNKRTPESGRVEYERYYHTTGHGYDRCRRIVLGNIRSGKIPNRHSVRKYNITLQEVSDIFTEKLNTGMGCDSKHFGDVMSTVVRSMYMKKSLKETPESNVQ